MSGKRCYLCGGKLQDGRCQDCGLDNFRSERKTYRLNYSATENRQQRNESVKTSGRQHSLDEEKKKEISQHTVSPRKSPKKSAYQLNGKARIRTAGMGKAGKGVFGSGKNIWQSSGIIFGVVVMVIGLGQNYMSSKEKMDVQMVNEEATMVQEPYEYLEKELSAEGEEFSIVLEPGAYKVGQSLPEGNYQVVLQEGRGTVSVEDIENSIYMWQNMGTDLENNELESWTDVRLFNGANIEVNGNVRVRLETVNGQIEEMIPEEPNPLTEEIHIQIGQTLTAGTDFAAGVYDVQSAGDWCSVSYQIPLHTDYEDEEMNVLKRSIWLSADEIDSVYHNAVFPEGATITAEDADVLLVPSSGTAIKDYDAYYDGYR